MSTTTTTKHDNDDEEEQEEPKLSDKERTMERIKQLMANGVVFQPYNGITEPEYTVFDTRGGLRSGGQFGRR